MSLAMSAIVPCTIWAFTVSALRVARGAARLREAALLEVLTGLFPSACPQIPMPFLPPSPPLGPAFGLGTATLLTGLLLFNSPLLWPALLRWTASWARGGDDSGPAQQLATGLK